MSMNTKPTTGRNGFQKSTYLLPLIAVLAAGLACGAVDGGPNVSNNPREFILDEASGVEIWNFASYLEADDVKGGGKTYHWGVEVQDKCPAKCSG